MKTYMPFRPHRSRIHCSVDVLFHAGVLRLARVVARARALEDAR